MATTTDIRMGISIIHNNQAWLVAAAQFVNPGKGSAFTRVKLRNLKSGKVVEQTLKSGEAFELVDVQKKRCQFLYKDGLTYNFMNNDDYEQFALEVDILGETTKYLLDGTECYAMYVDNIPVSIQIPPKMDFKVTSTPPGVRGDTATGGTKEAVLETGLVVNVPLFIEEGDIVRVNTETGMYDGKGGN